MGFVWSGTSKLVRKQASLDGSPDDNLDKDKVSDTTSGQADLGLTLGPEARSRLNTAQIPAQYGTANARRTAHKVD